MKSLSKRKNTKANTLRHAIVAALTAGSVAVAGPAFSDGKVTYDQVDKTLHIPVVHAGTDQYEVTMIQEETGNGLLRFVVIELSLTSKVSFQDSQTPDFGEKTLTLTKLVSEFSTEEFEVFDPLEMRNKTFRVIPVNDVLTKVYGDDWKTREEVLVKAADGFESSIAVEQFLNFDGYLAFEQVQRPQFIAVKDADGKYVELGPFWLIWDNETDKDSQASNTYFWPYQVAGFDFVTFADRFANALPPAGSSAEVQSGFEAARKHCLVCHKVNGDGGSKAPDFIKGGLVAGKSEDRLTQLALDRDAHPKSEVTGMVLREEIPNRDQVAAEIAAYLKAMDANK